ncbi:dihydropteroate synthase [Methylocella sp.]|uniref:dihydropteroate synthase n=1 Tax=Methylocella sp. TaxID=1978226 RepID=UPI003782ED30
MSEVLGAFGDRSLAARRDSFLARLGEGFVIMGIVNVTPDSFSDGGRFLSAESALAQARKLAAEGAQIVDVGAESTRPGHTPVPAEVERARLAPVLRAIVEGVAVPVSVDTSKASVARFAAEQGASVINDVWGLQRDPAMAEVVAETGAAVVLMHNRDDVDAARDVVDDMRRFFDVSLAIAAKAGIPRERLMLDPGIGFGKTRRQNFEALHGLGALKAYGLPILVGLSRKSMLRDLAPDGSTAQVEPRLVATLAANLAAAARGATIFRVHDAAEHAVAFRVFDAVERP